ncbi:TetR/AcrR family transcriptional regulator [Caballeronia humi]|jgi:AcrR family transcriptional regulator|uniref:TetR family transcriptional regulator n=1 Tax=Caballeronia humi TaxID=326474 RepID=A0A158J9W4_9BURK|nr:WHG domain-containing protein [Caballeronia humi]SAL65682.1 TetR family transcriptional regulator [Caballeronia humi]
MSEVSGRNPTAARTRKHSVKPVGDEHSKPYHHGSLPQALLRAAEIVLERDGIGGLSLRAIAREAGVSHTAPQHHFGDTSGVLSELAAHGFMRLSASMASHAEAVHDASDRRGAVARGYIDFAKKNPDLMRLMSRGEMLDSSRPSLIEARKAAAAGLTGVFNKGPSSEPSGNAPFAPMDVTKAVALTAAWAYVHGLALLLIDGRLNALAASVQGIRDADELVAAAIEHVTLTFEKIE